MPREKIHSRTLSSYASLAWNFHRSENAFADLARARHAGLKLPNEMALRQFVRLFLTSIFTVYKLGDMPSGPQAAFFTLWQARSKWGADYTKGVRELADMGLADVRKDEMGGWILTRIYPSRLIQDGRIIRGPTQRG